MNGAATGLVDIVQRGCATMSLDEEAPEELTRAEAGRAVVKLALGLGALLGAVALLSMHFRSPLERFGHGFVTRFGVFGVAGGSFLADGIHLPLPPQFYLFAGEAGGMPASAALISALVGSTLGGLTAFSAARRLGSHRHLAQRALPTRRLLQRLFDRHGYVGVAVAGTLPISYWVLCTLAGALRLPWRAYAVLAVMRVPRLLLSYALIAFAWRSS